MDELFSKTLPVTLKCPEREDRSVTVVTSTFVVHCSTMCETSDHCLISVSSPPPRKYHIEIAVEVHSVTSPVPRKVSATDTDANQFLPG